MADFEVVCSGEDRAAWLEARRSGIGSSDAPAVLGVSPFKSALAVYTEKLGLTADEEETEAMKWGRILEPHILEEFAAETGRDAWRAGQLIRSADIPWLMATLDGEQLAEQRGADVGNVEAKATGWRVGDWDEGIPHHVFVQAQHQLAVTGRRWGSVVVLQNGCRLLWADIERDDAFIGNVLLPAERDFWQRVQAREPVAPDGSESAARALRALYPAAREGVIAHLPGELIELDDELEVLKVAAKETERRAEEIRQRIKQAIGGAEIGLLPNGVSFNHRLQQRAGYTVKPTEFRQLRRSAPKGQ